MHPWQEMSNDLTYWLEEQGFDEVLDALISACVYWAEAGEDDSPLPTGTTKEQWAQRRSTRAQAQRWA